MIDVLLRGAFVRNRGGVRCLGSQSSQGLFIDNPASAPPYAVGLSLCFGSLERD